jgi:CheY-like chemotaxis protein/predicted regulator of Ras-like GTPase activity (Roadblock/LC7/MglB family)
MRKVLVVDDSVSVRTMVEQALGPLHVDVVCAGGANEAIERFEAEEPDLVICDVILPDRDGYHVCDHVRAHPRLSRVPVLLVSGIVNSTVLQRAAEVRSNDVMFKPFAADDLARKVDHLLAMAAPFESTPADPSVTKVASHAEAGSAGAGSGTLNAPGLDVKGCLEQFVSVGGVRAVVLADRDGFLVEAAGDPELSAEATAALAGCLAESSDGLGRELSRGALTGMMLEYESGTLLLHGVGSSAMLAILVDGTAVLGRVRYYAKKVLPELVRALAGDPLAYRP